MQACIKRDFGAEPAAWTIEIVVGEKITKQRLEESSKLTGVLRYLCTQATDRDCPMITSCNLPVKVRSLVNDISLLLSGSEIPKEVTPTVNNCFCSWP